MGVAAPSGGKGERAMHARVARIKAPGSAVGGAVEEITQRAIPALRQQRGFRAAYWLADREAGEGLTIILFDDEQALKDAEATMRPIREAAQQARGVTQVDAHVRGDRQQLARSQPATRPPAGAAGRAATPEPRHDLVFAEWVICEGAIWPRRQRLAHREYRPAQLLLSSMGRSRAPRLAA